MTLWMRLAATMAAVIMLAGGYAWQARGHYRRGYDAAYAEINEARLAQIAAAQAETDNWRKRAEEAESEHAKVTMEINRLRNDNSNLRAGVARLRRDIDAARAARVSAATGAACPDAAAALGDVLGECTARVERFAERYAALADAADRHAADAKRLSEAWPASGHAWQDVIHKGERNGDKEQGS